MRRNSLIILALLLCGCQPSLIVIPNGTLLRVADTTPITVATWDAGSKTWIVRGKANVNGYYCDPPLATTKPVK